MEANVKNWFDKLDKKLKYKDKERGQELKDLYKEKYEIEGPSFLDNVDTIDMIVSDLPFDDADKLEKTASVFGRVMLYLFVWIHIDLTVGIVLISQVFTFTVLAFVTGLGFAISSITLYALGDADIAITLFRAGIGILIAPLLYAMFDFIAYWLYKAVTNMYQFSIRFFWKKKVDLTIGFMEKKYNKLIKSRMVWIIVAITAALAGVLSLIAGNHFGWRELFETNFSK